MKTKINLALTITGIFAVLLALPSVVSAQFACDSGTLATTCDITSSHDITGQTITGTGNLVVQGTGNLYTNQGPGTTATIDMAGNVEVKSGGKIEGNIDLTAVDLTIKSGAFISANEKGYVSESGHGAGYGILPKGRASGAGYGGIGGGGRGNGHDWPGGVTYGSLTEPIDIGSGGGDITASSYGGSGGGAIKLDITGTLKIDGSITSNGGNGIAAGDFEQGGGGSGGSIWIIANTFSGGGSITANGGKGGFFMGIRGGGGGGGRIGIDICENSYTGTINILGGVGSNNGEPGTINYGPCRCVMHGGACVDDSDCCSGHCKLDYDGTGKFCGNADQCVHNGNVYNDGQDAPVCFNGCTKWYCNSGTWSTADCGSYTCSLGSCSGSCSQVCGATCDENADCMSYCTGDMRYSGGACNPLCTCSYSSEDCNNQDDNSRCNGAGLCDKDYYCSAGSCLFNWKNCDSCLDNDYIIDDNTWRDYTGCTPVAGLNNDRCGYTDRTCAGNDCIDLSQFPGDAGANACIGSCTFHDIDGEANNELCSLGDWIGAACFGSSCADDATDDAANYQCINDDGCCPAGCNAANDNDCSSTCGNGVTEPGEDCDNAVAQYQCGSSIGKGNDGHEWRCDSGTTSCKWVDQGCKDGCSGFCSNCALIDLDCSLPAPACIRDLTGNCGRASQYYGSACAGTEICQSDNCESLGGSINSVTPPSGTHQFNADVDTVVSFTASGSYSGLWAFLVECRLVDPNSCERDLDAWVSASGSQTKIVTLTETADVSGTWTLDYCLVYTDFTTNGGWGDYIDRNDAFFVCFVNDQPCSLDSDCCSGHCAADYDGTGKWCEPPTSCAHNAVEYLNGAIAPDCFIDGCSEWHCDLGIWSISDCGSYTCFAGSCTLACSQVCGAVCDENSDCALPNACGDIPGGSLCTPLQWEIIASYDCNGACVCDYISTCYDADDLKEACEICNSSVWDPITSRCCGDDGVSDTWCNDGNGACVNGIWHPDHCQDGVQNCDELEIDCSGEDGDCCICDGQFCLTGDECCSVSCALGLCMLLEDPEIYSADDTSDSAVLPLGSQSVLVLKVRNNLPVKDTIRLQLLGSPDPRIVYWSKFSNNDKSIDIEIASDEEVAIPISIFAGQVGIYELKIFAESLSYPSLTAHGSRIIYITSDDDSGLSSKSPGLSWLYLMMTVLVSLAIYHHKTQKPTMS